MKISILFFGQLIEIIGERKIIIRDAKDTDALLAILKDRFPALTQQKFVLAVNRKLIRANTILQEAAEVALLPPFSGG